RPSYIPLSIRPLHAALPIFILLFLPSPIWSGDSIQNVEMALAYLAGTVLSAIAGKIGIMVAKLSNSRAAEGAQQGIKPAFLTGRSEEHTSELQTRFDLVCSV